MLCFHHLLIVAYFNAFMPSPPPYVGYALYNPLPSHQLGDGPFLPTPVIAELLKQ
jgi:hypothetical protein